jgi:hypothetical protein
VNLFGQMEEGRRGGDCVVVLVSEEKRVPGRAGAAGPVLFSFILFVQLSVP